MGRVANGKDVGVTDGCECIVSDNLAAFSHRDAGIGGERRYQEARRPETFIKGNGSAIFHFGVTGVNGGDARAGIGDTQTGRGGGAIGVYSGARNPEMEEKCRAAGATFYIVKPVSREKLVEALAKTGTMMLAETQDGRVSPAMV